jgi:signal transduction histidine kinase
LRWAAIFGYLLAALLARFIFHVPLRHGRVMLTLLILTAINVVYYVALKIVREYSFQAELRIMYLHIIVDVLFLTLLIHYSGGMDNPVYLFYLFHVVLSSIIFPGWTPMAIATLVCALFVGLVLGEFYGWLPHYTLYASSDYHNPLQISVLLIIFLITIYFTAYICMSIMHIYRQSKRIIDRQSRQLFESGMEKTRFFQFASHELKSPVIAIKASTDVVLKTFSGSMDEKAVNLLTRVSYRAAQMLEIIKDLLELSKEDGLVKTGESQIVHLNRIIEKAIEQEQLQADTKKINFNLALSENEILVEGRPEDFEKIFGNLISNAVRYSLENSEVTIQTGNKENHFIFSIRDHGIGIKPEDINRVFNEFFRAENARQFIRLGTGLGLSLVKKLVESYRGQISVTSEPGVGSAFVVELPLSGSK